MQNNLYKKLFFGGWILQVLSIITVIFLSCYAKNIKGLDSHFQAELLLYLIYLLIITDAFFLSVISFCSNTQQKLLKMFAPWFFILFSIIIYSYVSVRWRAFESIFLFGTVRSIISRYYYTKCQTYYRKSL